MSFDGQAHAICVLFFKGKQVLWYYEGVKWLLSFNGTSIKQSLGYYISLTLSLTADITYISVFPGFWKYLPMILVQELLMNVSAAYIDSLSI